MMRILFLASRVPAPPIQGDRIRAYHQLRLLGERHEVILVAPVRNRTDRQGLQEVAAFCKRVEVVELPSRHAYWSLARSFRTGIPWQVALFCPPPLAHRVRALAREEEVDLIHIQLARMAPATQGVSAPVVIDLVDALSLNFAQRADLAPPPVAWVMRREAERLRAYEQVLLRTGIPLIVTSPVDRAAVGSAVHVVPNGVDIEAFPFVECDRRAANIVFCGRMDSFPNIDAAVFFARKVFPLIRREIPDARFLIAGAAPAPRVKRLGHLRGVAVLGFVPSMAEVLHRAAVAVCLRRVATGIQNKVIEAMAAGTPVVATSKAVGGIPDARDREHCLVEEEPEELASACTRLLRDRRLARHLSKEARALVEAQYTWVRSVSLLEAIYQQAIEHGRCAVH